MARYSPFTFWWLWLWAGVYGCASEPTSAQLVVAIHSDLRPGSELRTVELETYDSEGRGEVFDGATFQVAEGLADKGEVRLPFTVPVAKGKQASFLLVVTGYGPGEGNERGPKLVEYKARVAWGSERMLLRVFLGRACLQQLCEADRACYALGEESTQVGECGEIGFFDDLPPVVPGHELDAIDANIEDAGTVDASMDSSVDRQGDPGNAASDGANSPLECEKGFAAAESECLPVLSELAVDVGELVPAFDPGIQEYAVNAGLWHRTLGITAMANEGHELRLGGDKVGAGETLSRDIEAGENILELEVRAEGKSRNYRLVVTGRKAKETLIAPPEPEVNSYFGWSVALSGDGNVLVVGDLFGDEDKGAAYIFTRSAEGWSEGFPLRVSGLEAGDNFGAALSISHDGRTVAVSAPHEDACVRSQAATESCDVNGTVYLFRSSVAGWTNTDSIRASELGNTNGLGNSLSLTADGTTLAVGATGEAACDPQDRDEANCPNAGAVYVVAHSPAGWREQAYLKASTPVAAALFGASVSLSADGNALAVGAYGEDVHTGAVYVYRRSSTKWGEPVRVLPSAAEVGAQFGAAVSLSGDGTVLGVGAPWAGSVSLFKANSNDWREATPLPLPTVSAPRFGHQVAMTFDGRITAITHTGAEAAYVYADNAEIPGGKPSFELGHSLPAATSQRVFGHALAISHNGETLAVGTAQSGVYIYD